MKILQDVHSISVFIIKLFFITLPVFLLPFTFDILELNKSLLILLVSLLLLITLAIKSVKQGEFKLSVGYMTLPLAIMLVATAISFAFSSSTNYSLWGLYGSLSNSFPILFALILLPKLISTHLEKKEDVKDVTFFMLLGFGIVFMHSLLNYFGVFSSAAETSFGFLSNSNFNFFGSIINQKIVLILSVFTATHFVLRFKQDLTKMVISSVILLVSVLVSVLYFGDFSTLLVFASMGLAMYFYKPIFHKKAFYAVLSVFMLSTVLFVVKANPTLSSNLNMPELDTNSTQPSIDFKTSWAVTNSVIGSRLPFGSGIGTFSSDYSAFKPRAVNNSEVWDTRFTKPSSLYLLVLAEMGLVGFLSLAFLVFKFLTHGLGTKGELTVKVEKGEYDSYKADLSVAKIFVMGLLVSFLFTPGNALMLGTFFGLLGLVLALEKITNSGKVRHQKIGFAVATDSKDREVSSLVISGYSVVQLHVLVVFLTVLAFVASGIFGYRVFASDVAYRSFFNPPENLITLRDSYRKAANIHRNNDFYQRSVIQVNSQIARFLAQQNNENKDLTEDQKKGNLTDVQTLLTEATSRADYITTDTDMGISPVNWEVKGQLHQSLIGLNEQSKVTALQSYNVASSLDPLNPRIIATLGSVYYAAGEYEQARQIFERAVILKPDYAAARFNLANSLEKLDKYQEAYDVAKTIPSLLEVDTDDYKAVSEYIKSLEDKLKALDEKSKTEDGSMSPDLGLGGDQTNKAQPALTNPSEPLEGSSNTVPALPEVSKDSTTLPNQEPNTKEGSGFIEGQ